MGEGKGIQPIVDVLLRKNFLFGLEFFEGFVFGRVVRRRIMHYKPYNLINADGDAVDISASTHQTELRFRDPRNTKNDILFLNTTTDNGYPWFLHGGIGISPHAIYMYPRFPESKEIPGKFPGIDPISPSDGNDTGYVSARESPYKEPTNFVEYVIPPGQHVGSEYYNKSGDRAHQPRLNILFACYWFQVLTKAQHAGLVRRIASNAVPAALLTVGWGDTPIHLGSTIKKDWGVTPMSLDEALR